jgi:hypothetical protein
MTEYKSCVDCVFFEGFDYGDSLCTKFDIWMYSEQIERAKNCVEYREKKKP